MKVGDLVRGYLSLPGPAIEEVQGIVVAYHIQNDKAEVMVGGNRFVWVPAVNLEKVENHE